MAQNLFKFNTESDYRTAKRHNLIVPNVCLVIENGKTYINGPIASKIEAEAGDIIAANADGNFVYIKPEAFDRTMCDTYTPVGIVVIPATHTNNGDIIGMSLAAMSINTPTSGSDNNMGIAWGNMVSEANGYDGVVTISIDDVTNNNASIYTSELAYLPSDAFFDTTNGVNNIIDAYTKWVADVSAHTPSPYLKNGNKSSIYSTDTLTMNALQQMDGSLNKPASITENANPAMYVCDSYAVSPYMSGHLWYLPSLGELGYAMSRLGRIKYALSKVAANNTSRFKVAQFDIDQNYWSSTQSSDRGKVWALNPSNGQVAKFNRNEELVVRAFARF